MLTQKTLFGSVALFLVGLIFLGGPIAHAASATVNVGQAVTFTSSVDGTAPFTYQWYKNGSLMAGVTDANYQISNVQASNAGVYTVVISNSAGSTTSEAATITVTAAAIAPVITTQPLSQTVLAGAMVTFTAAASGTPVPTYQWKLNGTAISGATSSTLSMANIQSGNAGTYTVVATNSAGSATSTGANLTVNAATNAPLITTQPLSQTVTAGAAVTFTVAASGNPAPTLQWKLNGTNLSGATSATLSLSNVQSGNAGTYTVVATNSAGSVTSTGATLTVNSATNAPVITTQPLSQTVTAGTTVTFTAAASGNPTPTYRWRKNGTNISGARSASLTLTNVQSGNAGTYTVVVSNKVGSVTSNSATLTVGPVAVAPVITTQPLSQTVTAGANVTFDAAATGTPTPTYQWRKDGTNISGATSARYTIASTVAGNAGTYTVVATNVAGFATSSAAVLTVNAVNTAPTITTIAAQTTGPGTAIGPIPFTVGDAQTTAGSLTVTGSSSKPTLVSVGNIVFGGSGTNRTVTLTPAAGQSGTTTITVTVSDGSLTKSVSFLLTVSPTLTGPVFTLQPTSLTVVTGNPATFTVAASGNPAPTYQWRKNGTNIVGATSATYTIASAVTGNAATYTVVATNSVNSVTSQGAVLTVTMAASVPVITSQPISQTVTTGGRVTFDVVASSTLARTYQWQKNGSRISGATGASYTIASVASTAAGTYTVIVTNSAGSVTSSGAVLTVTAVTAPTTYNVDFNGDGKSDLLWQNSATGECRVWLMAGTAISRNDSIGTGPSGMRISGTGDFNADGKTDILWQNTTTGEGRVWFMNGATVSSSVVIGTVPLDWQMRGTGDFNGDGKSDIISQNTVTGECSVWLLNGTTLSSIVSLGQASTDLIITGTGDFNKDGQSDILWQNDRTGEYGVWLMAGTTVGTTVSLGTMSLDWQLSGTGDFNADSRSDILWQNLITGEYSVWLMTGTTVSSKITLGEMSPNWFLLN